MSQTFEQRDERRHAFERMMHSRETVTVPEYLEDYADALMREFAGLKPTERDFQGVHPKNEMERDLSQTRMTAEDRNEYLTDKETPTLAEAVLAIAPVEGDWLGEKSSSVGTWQYDDHRGTDFVYEFHRGDQILRFAVDVTTANRGAEEIILRKVDFIMRRAREGRLPATVKYFASEQETEVRGIIELPRVVIAIPKETLINLADTHDKVRRGEESPEALRDHAFKKEFLAQIRRGLASFEHILTRRLEATMTGGSKPIDMRRATKTQESAHAVRAAIDEMRPTTTIRHEGLRTVYENLETQRAA